jgi:tetratricopeptide (TPR) repeat protein
MTALVLVLASVLAQGKTDAPHIRAAVEAFHEAQTALRKKQFDSAIASFQKAVEIEPTFLEARRGLVDTQMDAGRRLEAAKALTQLLEIEPDDVSDHILLGQLLLTQQQMERALAQFSIATNLQPNNADALLGFATAASRLGLADRAKGALEIGRKKYPLDPRFQTNPRN